MQQLRRLALTPYLYIFALSYFGVWLIWDYLKLPLHVPVGAVGPLETLGYNPQNNVLRFLAVVFVPPTACLIYWLCEKYWPSFTLLKKRSIKWTLAIVAVIVGIALAAAFGILQASTNPANNPPDQYGGPYNYYMVDTFHEGETLGPAISYEQKDLKPYSNFVVIHGLFQDPLRSVLAFKLFGRSIGAERALNVILVMSAFIALFFLLLVLFRGNYLKALLGLSLVGLFTIPASTLPFIPSMLGIQLPFRDIPTIIFLIVAILGFRAAIAEQRRTLSIYAGIIGFLVTATYAYSLDRALYVTVLSGLWAVMVWLIVSDWRVWLKRIVGPAVGGLILGLIVLTVALKGDYSGVFTYISTILKYEPYLDGEPLNRPPFGTALIYLSLAAFVACFYVWLTGFWQLTWHKGAKQKFSTIVTYARTTVLRYHTEILLGFMALLFMRSAIERTDLGHFAYSIQWTYLLLIYLFVNYIFARKTYRLAAGFSAVVLVLFTGFFFAEQVKHIDMARDTFPIHVPDSKFVRPDYLQAANYLKKNLHGQQSFVTLTSEGIWYYLVDKAAPIQYPIIYYAFTQNQRQSVTSSIADNPNVKYLVTNNNWTTDFDYIPNTERFPDIYNNVLPKMYHPVAGFGQQTIWERN